MTKKKQQAVLAWVIAPLTAYIRTNAIKTAIANNAGIHHSRFNAIIGQKGRVGQLARVAINMAMFFASKQDFLNLWMQVGERLYDYADAHGDEFNLWSKKNQQHPTQV